MKRSFCKNTCSDHLTLLRAFDGWRNAKSRGEEWSFCRRYFLSNTTLRMIDEMRKQFFELLIGIGFVSEMRGSSKSSRRRWQKHLLNGPHNANASNLSLIRSVICAGLYPNILRIMPTKKEGEEPKIIAKDGEVFIHPVSVNFQEKRFNSRTLLVYMEKVKSSKVYIRDCSVISPYSVLLFGGSVKYYPSDKVVCVDGWLPFLTDRRVAAVMKVLRNELNELLERKIQRPNEDLTEASKKVMNAVSHLLWSEQKRVFKKMDIAFDDFSSSAMSSSVSSSVSSSAKRENFNDVNPELEKKETTTKLSSTAASFVPSSVRMRSGNSTTSFVPSSVRMKSGNTTTSFVPSSVRMKTTVPEKKTRRNRKKKDNNKDEKKNHDEKVKNEKKKKKKKDQTKKKEPAKKKETKQNKKKEPTKKKEKKKKFKSKNTSNRKKKKKTSTMTTDKN